MRCTGEGPKRPGPRSPGRLTDRSRKVSERQAWRSPCPVLADTFDEDGADTLSEEGFGREEVTGGRRARRDVHSAVTSATAVRAEDSLREYSYALPGTDTDIADAIDHHLNQPRPEVEPSRHDIDADHPGASIFRNLDDIL